MDNVDFAACTNEEIAQLVLQMSPDQIRSEMAKLTPEQISIVISVLDEMHDQDWREKLTAVIYGLNENRQIEAVGRALVLPQALHILDEAAETEKNGHWKLSPLLVGMPHPVFTQLLLAASPIQMNALKQEVITEPVQHHLTVLTHEIVHQIPEFAASLDNLELEIAGLNIADLGHAELKNITHRIEQGAELYEETVEKINKILGLAWNTNRTDLIEKLSVAKEICQKLIGSMVGARKTSSRESSGLFAKLEERLNTVFGVPDNPQDFEALDDDEPAIEALVKFSLWYLSDYWEIGLLPQVKSIEDLDLDSSAFSHQQRMEYREKLFEEVTQNLSKLGLNTVSDLKQARIFSAKSLQDHISRNKKFL